MKKGKNLLKKLIFYPKCPYPYQYFLKWTCQYRYLLRWTCRYRYWYFPKSPCQYRYRYRYFSEMPYRYRYFLKVSNFRQSISDIDISNRASGWAGGVVVDITTYFPCFGPVYIFWCLRKSKYKICSNIRISWQDVFCTLILSARHTHWIPMT